MTNPLRNLLRRVKNLTQPRPKSLGEWAQDHGEVVRVEIQRLLPHILLG